jgi:hypothetical protein
VGVVADKFGAPPEWTDKPPQAAAQSEPAVPAALE